MSIRDLKNSINDSPKREINENHAYKQIDDGYGVVISYISLKRNIGLLGISLPVLLMIFGKINHSEILPSISDYYYTPLRVLFTGILFVISIFLISSNKKEEKILSRMAAFCAILVAIFPTNISDEKNKILPNKDYTIEHFTNFVKPTIPNPEWYNFVHLTSAGAFFIILSILVLKIFIKDERKQKRSDRTTILVYKICGKVMIVSVSVMILYSVLNIKVNFPIIFLFETFALISFGIAWLLKGRILKTRIEETIFAPLKEILSKES